MADDTCSVDDCAGTHYARRWCHKHYQRWWKYGDTKTVRPGGFQASNPMERFWKHVRVDPKTGCWIWQAATDRGGYGLFKVKREGQWKTVLAHRFAYKAMIGPIPTDEKAGFQVTIDHLCRTRNCVNARQHMEVVSFQENIRRRRSNKESDHE